jgi:hypothetical protein
VVLAVVAEASLKKAVAIAVLEAAETVAAIGVPAAEDSAEKICSREWGEE